MLPRHSVGLDSSSIRISGKFPHTAQNEKGLGHIGGGHSHPMSRSRPFCSAAGTCGSLQARGRCATYTSRPSSAPDSVGVLALRRIVMVHGRRSTTPWRATPILRSCRQTSGTVGCASWRTTSMFIWRMAAPSAGLAASAVRARSASSRITSRPSWRAAGTGALMRVLQRLSNLKQAAATAAMPAWPCCPTAYRSPISKHTTWACGTAEAILPVGGLSSMNR